MTRAVFFDRDGIVNRRRPGEYVTTWAEFQFLPEIYSSLERVHALGFLAILVTNQRGISLGRMTRATLDDIHDRMQAELRTRTGAGFDAIEVCPHGNDDGCDCRKPQPGMILHAARSLAIDAGASWMIGDTESDVLAGNRAGCRTILVGMELSTTEPTHRVATLEEAVEIIASDIAGEKTT